MMYSGLYVHQHAVMCVAVGTSDAASRQACSCQSKALCCSAAPMAVAAAGRADAIAKKPGFASSVTLACVRRGHRHRHASKVSVGAVDVTGLDFDLPRRETRLGSGADGHACEGGPVHGGVVKSRGTSRHWRMVSTLAFHMSGRRRAGTGCPLGHPYGFPTQQSLIAAKQILQEVTTWLGLATKYAKTEELEFMLPSLRACAPIAPAFFDLPEGSQVDIVHTCKYVGYVVSDTWCKDTTTSWCVCVAHFKLRSIDNVLRRGSGTTLWAKNLFYNSYVLSRQVS
eukprot:366431-Chlamydomonas_euryale.AAC.9